ncbi:glycosyltransferase family 2 protein [Snuella lapsa]|uniref:Glycosyltransferase family 2 protein n=1 Tax=Snuella lapsa TaxID=870481 RepID=A0ABP6XUJ5_9FLAO
MVYIAEPLVSIIIPVYNRGDLVEATLDSILSQTYANWECIIVDDGSTDDTELVVNKFAKKDVRFKYLKRPITMLKGPNACRKYGFEKSRGDFVQWFDSDDVMSLDKLAYTVKTMNENSVDCVIHNFSYFRPNDYSHVVFNNFKKIEDVVKDYLAGGLVINFQSIIWKKKSLDMCFLNSKLSYAEDVYFIGNQFLQTNFKYAILDEVLVFIRKHDKSLTTGFSNRSPKLIEDEVYVREYFFKKTLNMKKVLFKGSLKMYLKALKYLLYAKAYPVFFKNMFEVFRLVHNKLKLVVIKLSILGLFYIFTGKGLTAYQKTINTL